MIFSLGEQLINTAKNGELSKFKRLCFGNDISYIAIYFIAKAFQVSLLNGHLMLSRFIVENGFPLNPQIGLPNFLHECLSVMDDESCVPVIIFFVNSNKGFEINHQAMNTWLTPLHIAVQRLLCDCVEILITYGADVNAVADHDLMPLNIVQSIIVTDDENIRRKELITNLLVKNGAKETWRSGVGSSQNVISSSSSSTSACAKGDLSTANKSNSNSEEGKKKMVRFTGGSINAPVEEDLPTVFNKLEINDGNTFSISDDGGLLFSTG